MAPLFLPLERPGIGIYNKYLHNGAKMSDCLLTNKNMQVNKVNTEIERTATFGNKMRITLNLDVRLEDESSTVLISEISTSFSRVSM